MSDEVERINAMASGITDEMLRKSAFDALQGAIQLALVHASVHEVRQTLYAMADELEEFDNG